MKDDSGEHSLEPLSSVMEEEEEYDKIKVKVKSQAPGPPKITSTMEDDSAKNENEVAGAPATMRQISAGEDAGDIEFNISDIEAELDLDEVEVGDDDDVSKKEDLDDVKITNLDSSISDNNIITTSDNNKEVVNTNSDLSSSSNNLIITTPGTGVSDNSIISSSSDVGDAKADTNEIIDEEDKVPAGIVSKRISQIMETAIDDDETEDGSTQVGDNAKVVGLVNMYNMYNIGIMGLLPTLLPICRTLS